MITAVVIGFLLMSFLAAVTLVSACVLSGRTGREGETPSRLEHRRQSHPQWRKGSEATS